MRASARLCGAAGRSQVREGTRLLCRDVQVTLVQAGAGCAAGVAALCVGPMTDA
jgi:hypothetical protein